MREAGATVERPQDEDARASFGVQKAKRRESGVDRVIAVQPIISQVYGKDVALSYSP